MVTPSFAAPAGRTGGAIEHPERDLLKTCGRRTDTAAARYRTSTPDDHLMDADALTAPEMPAIGHRPLVGRAGTVGLVVAGCTMPSGRIQRLAVARLTRYTSTSRFSERHDQPAAIHLSDPASLFRQAVPPLVLDGSVIGRNMQRHRHQEFIRFLNAVEAELPSDKDGHVILDNYATHKQPKVRAWLAGIRAGPSTSCLRRVPG